MVGSVNWVSRKGWGRGIDRPPMASGLGSVRAYGASGDSFYSVNSRQPHSVEPLHQDSPFS